jgi:hypothetical protein
MWKPVAILGKVQRNQRQKPAFEAEIRESRFNFSEWTVLVLIRINFYADEQDVTTMSNNPIFVTAAEAGIPEVEQTKIVLELILSQGGVAVMPQIYEAIEKRLPRDHYLSQQGKNSLRRVVNTRAVHDGYIHRYDRSNPGWRITDDGVNYVRRETGRHIGDLKFTARATVNFNLAIKEIRSLLDYYASASQDQNNKNLEVFKRSSVILVVTAWESYIEDMLGLHINNKLDNAKSPNDIPKAFNTVANNWYISILNKHDNHPKPNDFSKWTGDNWKELIRGKLQEDLFSLNTPKSGNISDLTKRYLGVDVTQKWNMPGTTAPRVSRKLDQIIELRGEITHRIVNYFEARSTIRQNSLISSVDFVERLANRTEVVLDLI